MNLLQSVLLLFTYLQNISLASDLPFNRMPESLKNFFSIFTKFLLVLINYIKQIPAFDIRIQLVFISIGIPFILDLIFNLFAQPFLRVVKHILDLVVIIFVMMNFVEGIMLNFTTGKIFVLIMGIIYLICRIILIKKIFLHKLKKNTKKSSLNISETDENINNEKKKKDKKQKQHFFDKFMGIICDVFMTTIVPGFQSKYDINDVEKMLSSHSRLFEYSRYGKVSRINNIFLCILIFLLYFLSILFHPKLKKLLNMKYAKYVSYTVPYICFIIASLLLFYFLFRKCKCGQKILLKLKLFFIRYGLQILMFALELIYIPTVKYLFINLIPVHYSCGVGYYLQYSRHKPIHDNSVFFPFVNHSWSCLSCYPVLVSTKKECLKACSGKKEWRVYDALNLRYFDDAILVIGAITLFIFVAYIIGIPLLWRYIIMKNQSSISHICTCGRNFEQKWANIMDHLSTNGAYLFKNFRFAFTNWGIFHMFYKLIFLLITIFSGFINSKIIWGMPLIYVIMFITVLINDPYNEIVQYILNLVLILINFYESIVLLLPIYGKAINEKVHFITTVSLYAFAFIAMIILFILHKNYHLCNDPTWISPKELKKIKKKNKSNKIKNERPKFPTDELPPADKFFKMYEIIPNLGIDCISYEYNEEEDESDTINLNENNNISINENATENFFIQEQNNPESNVDEPLKYINGTVIIEENQKEYDKKALFIWDVKQDANYPKFQNNDFACISGLYFDSIETYYHVLNWDTIKDENGNDLEEFYTFGPSFKVNKRVLYNRINRMYKMIDILLDGLTMELLTQTLNIMMLFGAMAFGWYLGAILANEKKIIKYILWINY